jgi:hypothetical protein
MLKLMICLFCGATTAITLLELRQQQLDLTFQTNRLHNQIEATQAKLWNQQLSIAQTTAPNALSMMLKGQGLKLAPTTTRPGARMWIENPAGAE